MNYSLIPPPTKKMNSPIKPAYQENCDEVVYLSRTWHETLRSKLLIERFNYMEKKLGSSFMGRKIGKTKVNPESREKQKLSE